MDHLLCAYAGDTSYSFNALLALICEVSIKLMVLMQWIPFMFAIRFFQAH